MQGMLKSHSSLTWNICKLGCTPSKWVYHINEFLPKITPSMTMSQWGEKPYLQIIHNADSLGFRDGDFNYCVSIFFPGMNMQQNKRDQHHAVSESRTPVPPGTPSCVHLVQYSELLQWCRIFPEQPKSSALDRKGKWGVWRPCPWEMVKGTGDIQPR